MAHNPLILADLPASMALAETALKLDDCVVVGQGQRSNFEAALEIFRVGHEFR